MKRIISLLVVFCITFVFVFTGCSSGTPSNVASSTSEVSTTSQNTTKEVIKVYYLDSAVASRQPSDPNVMVKLRNWIIEQTSIDPQPYIPVAGAEAERLNIILSGTEPLDMFIGDYSKYEGKGVLQPINDLLDKYGIDIKTFPLLPEAAWKPLTDKDGNIWGIPRVSSVFCTYPVQIRQDWLDKLKLKMPKSIDELEAILKIFKEQDPSGTGETIPMLTDYKSLVNGMLGGFVEGGNGHWWDDSEKKLKPSVLDPGYKDFVSKMNDWYKKGYIQKETFVSTKDQKKELITQNKVGVSLLWYSTVAAVHGATKKIFPEFQYRVAEEIKGPKGGLQTLTKASTEGLLFPKNSQNPEAMMQYLNWQYQDNGLNRFRANLGPTEFGYWKLENGVATVLDSKTASSGEFLCTYAGNELAGRPKLENVPQDGSDDLYQWYYLQQYVYNEYSGMGQRPDDHDVIYSQVELDEKIPTLADINKMQEGEVTKFIIGSRPMSEWDKFIGELYSAGMQNYIDAYTEQYLNATK